MAELPPMPSSIQEVISACDDQDMTVGQLSQVVLRDQSLTANILKLANSSFYGHARRVTTVTEAVVMLGFSAIKSLAISSHTARLLSGSLPGYGLQQGELWRHSISVAFTARRLAVEVQLAPVEEAFVAGLLLDIGKTILSSYMENAFDEVTRISQERRVPFHEVEAELLGFDHAELGAQIASSWSFPPGAGGGDPLPPLPERGDAQARPLALRPPGRRRLHDARRRPRHRRADVRHGPRLARRARHHARPADAAHGRRRPPGRRRPLRPRLMFPDDLTTEVLTASLRGHNARNTAIANNIANAETPGYKRIDVSFEAALAQAVESDRSRLSRGENSLPTFGGTRRAVDDFMPGVRSVDTTTMRVDGSNVDPDDEMAQLSANTLAHQTVVSLLDKRFAQFRTAIMGR